MNKSERHIRILVKWLIEGSRGGPTRARILLLLAERPQNPNQISRALKLNYRTVIHHLEVLERHGLVERIGEGYGVPYTISEHASIYWSVIKESICRILGGEEC